MIAPDSAIAKKHIEMTIRVQQIAKRIITNSQVFMATYRTGSSGQSYQRIEQDSAKEFWSLKAWTPPPHQRLKDPDALIAIDERVLFFIEIKWGSVYGRIDSDLLMRPPEWSKISQLGNHLINEKVMCRVRGPAVQNGIIYPSQDFPTPLDFWSDSHTKLLLVSDFRTVRQRLGATYQEFRKQWGLSKSGLIIADIETEVDDIPSLSSLLKNSVQGTHPS